MQTIDATIPCAAPPVWAFLERALFDLLERAVEPFLAKYTRADGALIWRDAWGPSRDGADDFYESSGNWPLLYLLGGGDHVLPLARRQWEAVTRQLTALGPVHKEYERGYDQFHQSESYTYFYNLCLADPSDATLIARARRFAGFYLNADPEAPNYDAERALIRAPHNGSGGPRWGFFDSAEPSYGWSAGMARYGLPYHDLPGIRAYDDLKDPALARRMGAAMQERMGRGDVATNLFVTSLVTNAALLTGDPRYRAWVAAYVDAWRARAAANGGLLPDQVGLSGAVGEYLGGKWYGGLYGWTWPHGFYNLQMAALVAAGNALLLTRDARYLDLPREQLARITALGQVRPRRDLEMSLAEHWVGQLGAADDGAVFVVPYRHGDAGWFDYQPLSPIYPVALWQLSAAAEDRARIADLRARSAYDWRAVRPFRTKEDGGHEPPWYCFLAGEAPGYPEAILGASYGEVCRRLTQIREDTADLRQVHIHHWQELNPVTTEALVQLTLGAPQPLYNGGLLHARVRYFDAERKRPGLPRDVAALVTGLDAARTQLHLVNLSAEHARDLIVQAGAFGEHQFLEARYSRRVSAYPGAIGSYAAPPLETADEAVVIDAPHLHVHLPPASELRLELTVARYANAPSYALPW